MLEEADDHLVDMVNLMLNTKEMKNIDDPQLLNDAFQRVSMSIIKAKGNNLQSSYSANFGQMVLPYWETFQDSVKNKDVMMNVTIVLITLIQ